MPLSDGYKSRAVRLEVSRFREAAQNGTQSTGRRASTLLLVQLTLTTTCVEVRQSTTTQTDRHTTPRYTSLPCNSQRCSPIAFDPHQTSHRDAGDTFYWHHHLDSVA